MTHTKMSINNHDYSVSDNMSHKVVDQTDEGNVMSEMTPAPHDDGLRERLVETDEAEHGDINFRGGERDENLLVGTRAVHHEVLVPDPDSDSDPGFVPGIDRDGVIEPEPEVENGVMDPEPSKQAKKVLKRLPRQLLELRRTRMTELVREVFNSAVKDFKFTTELETDYEDGYIPTLDSKIRVMDDGSISYCYFEKPVTSKLVIMADAALSDNIKASSLAQEVIRRLSNTQEMVCRFEEGVRKESCDADRSITRDTVMDILDKFDEKLVASGYPDHKRREILKAGITGYKRKTERVLKETGGLKHKLEGVEGVERRRIKRVLDKTGWIRKKGSGDLRVEGEGKHLRGRGKGAGGGRNDKEPMAVLFVPRTPGGALLQLLRAKEKEISKVTGDSIKIVERGGTPLDRILVKKDPWSHTRCSSVDCTVCSEENASICKVRNLVYTNTCEICKRKGILSVYWGQSSR